MEESVLDHYKSADWDNVRGYFNLNWESERILQFKVPANSSVSFLKWYTPHLGAALTLGFPTTRVFEAIFSSERPSCAIPNQNKLFSLRNQDLQLKSALQSTLQLKSNLEFVEPWAKKHLLYASIRQNLNLDIICSSQLTPNALLFLSASGKFRKSRSDIAPGELFLMFAARCKSLRTHLSYLSKLQTFGGSVFYTPKWVPNFGIGGEVQILSTECSGAASVGFTYSPGLSESISNSLRRYSITVMTNPIFGHVQATITSQLLPGVVSSVRYKINAYSHDANLDFGLEYKDAGLSKNSLSLKLGREMGILLTYNKKKYGVVLGADIDIFAPSRRSMGIEIRIS